MTTAAAQALEAWSEVFSAPVITELAPHRVWAVATERGDRYVLKKVSTFGARDAVRRFSGEARILAYLLQRGVPVAVPVLSNDGHVCTTDDDGAPYAVFPMLREGSADNGPRLDAAFYQNVGAAIARLHIALADCPFGVESWEIGTRPARIVVADGAGPSADRRAVRAVGLRTAAMGGAASGCASAQLVVSYVSETVTNFVAWTNSGPAG